MPGMMSSVREDVEMRDEKTDEKSEPPRMSSAQKKVELPEGREAQVVVKLEPGGYAGEEVLGDMEWDLGQKFGCTPAIDCWQGHLLITRLPEKLLSDPKLKEIIGTSAYEMGLDILFVQVWAASAKVSGEAQ